MPHERPEVLDADRAAGRRDSNPRQQGTEVSGQRIGFGREQSHDHDGTSGKGKKDDFATGLYWREGCQENGDESGPPNGISSHVVDKQRVVDRGRFVVHRVTEKLFIDHVEVALGHKPVRTVGPEIREAPLREVDRESGNKQDKH